MTLVVIQTTESLIALCMNFVLQDDPPMTPEKFHRLMEKQRSTTLGKFINQLRRRVALDEDFDARLGKFLEMRNQFVHGLCEVKGLSFNTKPGLEVADIFVRTLATDATYFIKVFAGIIREWQEQQGWPSLIPEGAEALKRPGNVGDFRSWL